jgi:histidine phosphotransfer protein HptB
VTYACVEASEAAESFLRSVRAEQAGMGQTSDDRQYIYSHLSSDPDLADIVEMFVQEMPGRAQRLTGQMDAKDWDGLQHTVHQLKGAAGSYGFEPVSRAAAKAESAVRNAEPEEQVRATLEELLDLCGRVRCQEPA